jgi:serine/threonine protein kinase
MPFSDPSASISLRAGDHIAGRYALLEPLAIGGMGEVWRARNFSTDAEVAAKVLLPMHAQSGEGFARFRREARATAALSHRAIVRVFDLIELDADRGPLVMIMELLRGPSLAKQLQKSGRLSLDETLQIAFPLLSALTHAHKLGIVHRDLKPENIVLAEEPDGTRMPKIVDFGISKFMTEHPITLDGQIVGTLSYMSPEQMRGEPVDVRSDVFSMGIVLYECLSGRNPFASALPGNARGTLSLYDFLAVLQLEPPPLDDVPAPVWQVIRRALAKEKEERYSSAAELTDALCVAALCYAPPLDARASTILPSVIEPPAPLPIVVAPRSSSRGIAAALFACLSVVAVASVSSVVRSDVRDRALHHAGERSLALHSKAIQAPRDVVGANALELEDYPTEEPAEPPASEVRATTAGPPSPAARVAVWDRIRRKPPVHRTAVKGLAREPGF